MYVVIGVLPDGTALVGGESTVVRVRVADGSTDAPTDVVRRRAPGEYIEAVLKAGAPGCVDGKHACGWMRAKPACRAGDAEVDYAVRWLEGLDRTIERLFFKGSGAKAWPLPSATPCPRPS